MLTLLPTPLGNLGDISLRSLQALQKANILMCEDVRVTKKLLQLLSKVVLIKTNFPEIFEVKKFLSFHSHNQEEFLRNIDLEFFKQNDIVFMSDAGMPCVSDPGMELVAYAQRHSIVYDVLPGASASVSAYCFSGFGAEGFVFAGFLPHKQKDRRERMAQLLQKVSSFSQDIALIVYESPHRIIDSLSDLVAIAPKTKVFAIKEMTKIHQRFFTGLSVEVLKQVSESNISGEWVLVLQGEKSQEKMLSLTQIEEMSLPPKIKAKLISKIENVDIKIVYDRICLKNSQKE